MEEPNSITREFKVEADPATVFAFFTDPERLTRWVGTSAQIDARVGGLFMIDVVKGRVARGEYTEVVPVTRLAYTWGWIDDAQVPPGSSRIEIDLLPQNGSTLVRFNHSGLPASEVPGHSVGWTHYLARLVIAAGGGDPGPDLGPPGRARG